LYVRGGAGASAHSEPGDQIAKRKGAVHFAEAGILKIAEKQVEAILFLPLFRVGWYSEPSVSEEKSRIAG
jgi:hypothetical protein